MGLLTTLSRWYRYSLARFYAPSWTDFAAMGIGIEARYARCAKWWDPHLWATREFVRQSLLSAHDIPTLHVLGAGRLLDIDCDHLLSAAKTVGLYDIDHSSRGFWPHNPRVAHRIVDVSGVLSEWTQSLERFLYRESPSISALISFLEALPSSTNPSISIAPHDAVVSLNILSQLPIYWRNRVERLLQDHWRFTTDSQGNFQHEVQKALDETYRRLQADHLALCARSGRLILITDDSFAYYRKEISPWQIEQALYVDVTAIDGMVCTHSDTWLWHIAPQGIENEAYGEMHRVVARTFVQE